MGSIAHNKVGVNLSLKLKIPSLQVNQNFESLDIVIKITHKENNI